MRTAVQKPDTKSSADSSGKSRADQPAGLGLDPPGDLLDLQRIIRGAAASSPKNGVQRKAAAESTERGGDPIRVAESGLSGEEQPLPHFDRIQQAFGPGHDLSDVRAHIGGPADGAARALGASAYTKGNHVAFRAPPDVRLAAHEAAHVVQQRGGVHLKNDVGQVDDPYERHADEVAERVAAGKSAAELLPGAGPPNDAGAGQPPAGGAPPPQDQGAGAAQPPASSESQLLSQIEAWGKVDGGMDALLAEADAAMAKEEPSPPAANVPVVQRKPGDPPAGGDTPPGGPSAPNSPAPNSPAPNSPAPNSPPAPPDPYGIARLSPDECKEKVLAIIRDKNSGAAYLQGKIEGDYLHRLLTKSMGYDAVNPLASGGAPHERAMAVVALAEDGALSPPMLEGLQFALQHPNAEIKRLGFRALSKIIDDRGLQVEAVSKVAEAGLDAMEKADLMAYQKAYPALAPAIVPRLALYEQTDFSKPLTITNVALKTFLRRLLLDKETAKLQALLAGPNQGRMLPLLLDIVKDKEEDAAAVETGKRFQRVLALAESLRSRPVSEIKSLAEGLGKDAAQAIDAFLAKETDRGTDRYRELHQLGSSLNGQKALSAPAPKAAEKIKYLVDSEGLTAKTLQSKMDLLIGRASAEIPHTKTDIERLTARKVELAKTPAKDLEAEAKQLDKGMLLLDAAVELSGMLPDEIPDSPPEIKDAVTKARAALDAVAGALATASQDDVATKLLEARKGYVDAYSKKHLKDASDGKEALADLAKKPDDLVKFTNGYARLNKIYFTNTENQWDTLTAEVDDLKKNMDKMGDLKARVEQPLADRLKFMASEGSEISNQLRRVHALTTLANAFRIGAALMKGVTDQDDIVDDDVKNARTLVYEVIIPLTAAVENGKTPDAQLVDKASRLVNGLFPSVESRLKSLAEAHKRQEWAIEIASTVVGMGAMGRAMKAMKAIEWFYRGGRVAYLGKQALKFAIGSLIFTTASGTTKAILTGKLPTPLEFAKQAGVDLATLGLLHGANHLVGSLFIKPGMDAVVKEAIQLGTTFGTLWLWASGQTIWSMKPGERTLDNVLKAVAETGARSALDLAVLHIAGKFGAMPEHWQEPAKEAQRKELAALYDATRAEAKGVEKDLLKWRQEGSDPKKLDSILKRGEVLIGRFRSLYERMVDAGALKPEEKESLTKQSFEDQAQIQNVREASRLRLQDKSDSTRSYRANERDIDLYLKRLKAQGTIAEITARGGGVFEVKYADGTNGWFYPEGTPPPSDGKSIYQNEVLSSEVRHVEGLEAGLKKFVAAERVRFVQGSEPSGAKLVFKDGFPVIRLGQAYTAADIRAAVGEAERLWVDPKGGKKVEVAAAADKSGWEQSKETHDSLKELKDEKADQPATASREHLAQEIERQVPDLKLFGQVQAGTAKIVITLIVPGGGPTGVKTMNDRLIGYELNNSLFAPKRNAVFAEAFLGLPFNEATGESMSLVEQSYKSTTLTTTVADAARLQRLMSEGMRRVDIKMHKVLTEAMKEGKDHWTAKRDEASGDKDSEQYKDAKKRVESIEQVLADLAKAGPEGFRYDVQFGMAEIKGSDVKTADQAYKAALEAKMNAAKAAIMVRSGGEKAGQEAAGGDTRGHMYDEKSFLDFAASADALRAQIVAAGNVLTIDRRPMDIFVEQEGQLLPNPDILRDVRKEKIKAEDLSPSERAQLDRVKKYMDHINAFDYIKGFTGKEAAETLPGRIQAAQAMLDALRSGKSVDPAKLRSMLTHDVRGKAVAQLGTASEVAFYDRARSFSDRILLNADIIDLGLDAMMAYAKSMHAAGAGKLSGEALYEASAGVSDPILKLRRDALRKVNLAYEAQRRKAIDDLQKLPHRDAEQQAALDQLRREGEPLVLLGGDEITLSLHPAMKPYVPELVAAVADACRGRVAVTRAQTDPAMAKDEAARVEAHRKAMGQADPATSVLKSFEMAQRKLDRMVEQITDPAKKADAQAIVDNLGLGKLYADVDPANGEVKLRRFKSGADVTEADLKKQIADAEGEIHKRFGAPLPTVVSTRQQKKDDDEEIHIKPERRPALPAPAPRVDFGAEALERAAPGVAGDVREQALRNLRKLPYPQVNEILVNLPTGKADGLVAWLAGPGMGDVLAAFDSGVAAALLSKLLAVPADFTRIKGISAEATRWWYQSGFEKIAGGRDAGAYLRFLADMEKYRGSLAVKSLEEAKQAVDAYSKTAPATPFNPGTPEAPQATIGLPGTPASPPAPYQSDGDYLRKNGYKNGTFARVYIDEGRWIIQSVDGQLSKAWYFQGEMGTAPTKTLDIAAALKKLDEGAANAKGKPKEEARKIAAGLDSELKSLDFLRRVRDLDTKSATMQMDAIEALKK